MPPREPSMSVVFMGSSNFAVPSLNALRSAGRQVAAVVSRPDRPGVRRSGHPGPTPVKTVAVLWGVPVLEPEDPKDPAFADQLRQFDPQVIVVAAYGKILPASILGIPRAGCVNLHASLLPRYRGAAPVARAILAGEKIAGVTTIRMNQKMDAGDILMQAECAIGISETAGELTDRLADLGAGLLVQTLERYMRGDIDPRRQDEREVTFAPALSREDGRIVWSAPAEEITNRVRACNPWPVAFTELRGEPVQILRAEVSFERPAAPRQGVPPGQVVATEGNRVLVQCGGDVLLALLELRFPGRRAISAADAVNGRLLHAGDMFGRAFHCG